MARSFSAVKVSKMSQKDQILKVTEEVAGLRAQMELVRGGLDRNVEATCALREDFQRLRGEINGRLPALQERVEQLVAQVTDHHEAEKDYHARLQVHEQALAAITRDLAGKADGKANETEHGRLWLALRLFFYGTLVALMALLLERVLR